jgi:hypothetical protein
VPDRVLRSADELGPLVDIHPESLRRMARQGRIPSVSIGRALRFDLEEVVAACRNESHQSTRVAATPNFDALETRDGD